MKEIILIGGGGHCKSVIDVIEQESQNASISSGSITKESFTIGKNSFIKVGSILK